MSETDELQLFLVTVERREKLVGWFIKALFFIAGLAWGMAASFLYYKYSK